MKQREGLQFHLKLHSMKEYENFVLSNKYRNLYLIRLSVSRYPFQLAKDLRS